MGRVGGGRMAASARQAPHQHRMRHVAARVEVPAFGGLRLAKLLDVLTQEVVKAAGRDVTSQYAVA